MKFKILFFLSLINHIIFGQIKNEINWWNPIKSEFPVMDGQGWSQEVESIFHRLPIRAKDKVRKEIWDLSKQSAGLSIRFWTNADSINVKYKLKGELFYDQISSLGVSGLDLYSKSYDGAWMRCWGEYTFDETTSCTFIIDDRSHMYSEHGREYQLLLPLFNEVESLEIGVNEKHFFKPLPVRKEKPIVAYGTSICQGANASRPGMSWANILGRKLDRQIINLGFSGNGRLEPEIIDLMTEIEAKLYILDCLPNLVPMEDDVHHLVISAVQKIREKRESVPIILTAHQGFTNKDTNANNKRHSQILDTSLIQAFRTLKAKGDTNLYLLENKGFSFEIDSYADYGHPNDYGMIQYARAYERIIRKVLNEPIGKITTSIPKAQSRDIATYNWEDRHQKILELNKANPPKICLFGDSIINFWGGEPEISTSNGQRSWENIMKPLGVRNFGFGYDRIENVLWRVYHDELDGFDAEQIILMIGVNNLHLNTNSEIITGLSMLIRAVKIRQPKSKITILGVLPALNKEMRLRHLNEEIALLASIENVYYRYFGIPLISPYNGKIHESNFIDGLHPNANGYDMLAKEFQQVLKEN